MHKLCAYTYMYRYINYAGLGNTTRMEVPKSGKQLHAIIPYFAAHIYTSLFVHVLALLSLYPCITFICRCTKNSLLLLLGENSEYTKANGCADAIITYMSD